MYALELEWVLHPPSPELSSHTLLLDWAALRRKNAVFTCLHNSVLQSENPLGHARIFHSKDGGLSWTTADTAIDSVNASSGVFSVACCGGVVMAVGGDYKDPAKANWSAVIPTIFA
jgi:hypothetical protein